MGWDEGGGGAGGKGSGDNVGFYAKFPVRSLIRRHPLT